MASQASRFLFLFVLGLFVGAVAAVMMLRTLQARQDPFPHSVMHVMDKQVELLKHDVGENHCTGESVLPRLQTLRAVSNNLEIAFPDLAEDHRFTNHASRLRTTLENTLSAQSLSCQEVQASLAKIEDACQACHNDFAQ